MKVRTNINICDIAAKLAHSDDIEQARFLDVFFTELEKHCETEHSTNMQLHAINSKLRSRSIEHVETLSYRGTK